MDVLSVVEEMEYVPYRPPETNDLNALREELSLQIELHGRRSSQALAAFNGLFAASVRLGQPLDGLRQYSTNEVERFFARTVEGTGGHVYFSSHKTSFRRNDGKTRMPRRWWWEHLNGPISTYEDVVPNCGEQNCINPRHCLSGRSLRRRWFSDEQMIGTLQVVAMRLGHTPNTKEWTAGKYTPTSPIYVLRFGSWRKATDAAGLPPASRSRVVGSVENSYASLREARRFLGHIPGYEEFRRPDLNQHLKDLGLLTSQNTIKRQIGPTWKDALAKVFQ